MEKTPQRGTSSFPNVVRIIKSRRLRWAGHVLPEWRKIGVLSKFEQVNLQGGLVVDGRTKLEWPLKK